MCWDSRLSNDAAIGLEIGRGTSYMLVNEIGSGVHCNMGFRFTAEFGRSGIYRGLTTSTRFALWKQLA